jgi:hypothetical protein
LVTLSVKGWFGKLIKGQFGTKLIFKTKFYTNY